MSRTLALHQSAFLELTGHSLVKEPSVTHPLHSSWMWDMQQLLDGGIWHMYYGARGRGSAVLQGWLYAASRQQQPRVAKQPASHGAELSAKLMRSSAFRPVQMSQPRTPLSWSISSIEMQIPRSKQLKLHLDIRVCHFITCRERVRLRQQDMCQTLQTGTSPRR